MSTYDAQSIGQLALAHFHNPEVVRALIQQIVLLKGAGERRVALRALVGQLIAADQLEEAVGAARLATDLTPSRYVNDVDPFLKAELLISIVDRLLDRGQPARAAQLLDEASLCMEDLGTYERYDLPVEEPWLQLSRRYVRAGAPERNQRVWNLAIDWARAIERGLDIPERHFFQSTDGTSFLVRIAEDMARYGEHERALEIAAAIVDPAQRASALARVQSFMPQTPPP